jgi:hypothetical protein
LVESSSDDGGSVEAKPVSVSAPADIVEGSEVNELTEISSDIRKRNMV